MGIFFFFYFSIVSLLSNVFIWGLYFYFFAFLYILYQSIYETRENSEYSCWFGWKQLREELHWRFGSSASYMVCTRCMCEVGCFLVFFLSVAKQDGNVWSFCPADSGPGDRDADRQTTKDWCPDSDLVISGLMGAHDRFPAFFCSFLCKHLRMFLCLPGLEQIENSSDFHVRNYQTKCATLKLNAIRLTTWNADICMCRH